MADPRSHVRPGQPLAIAAEQINWLNGQMRGQTGFSDGLASMTGAPYMVLPCENTTPETVPRWGVMAVDGLAVAPDGEDGPETRQFLDLPVLQGGTPEEGGSDGFVIALEPIPTGKIGRVAVSGIVQVKLEVKGESDTTAGPKAGSCEELQTGKGSAAILWKESGTGSGKWGLVRVHGGGGGIRLGTVPSAWTKGTTAEIDIIYADDCDNEGSGGEKVEAHNISYDVAAGAKVVIALATNGCWYMVEASNDCDEESEGSGECGCTSLGGEDLKQLEGYDASKTQVLAHDKGCLKWIDTVDCAEGSS